MFDGIKILDLSVSADALLLHHRLQFGAKVDLQTGAVLDQRQRAADRGLAFALIPTRADRGRYRVELVGSLHRYGRGGLHNADDFTATDLRETLEELVNTYSIDPHGSNLNNLEFGVNLQLPYPVADLLRALICYRGIPFDRHTDNGFTYYQAALSQYVVKIYDKADQYQLPANVLRFEVKVLRMQYLHSRGIAIETLADLLNHHHYPTLGRLLAETFRGILFDEPHVSVDNVPPRHRELLLKGRTLRYWQRPDPIEPGYQTRRKQLQREEERFRMLLADHRPGNDWQGQTAALLSQKWEELTYPDQWSRGEWLTTYNSEKTATEPGINSDGTVIEEVPKCPKFTDLSDRETVKEPGVNCPKFTDVTAGGETGQMSQIYPLNVGEFWDTRPPVEESPTVERGTPQNHSNQTSTTTTTTGHYCPVTGVPIPDDGPGHVRRVNRRFVSATMLRTDDDLMKRVKGRFSQYAKGSKEDAHTRTAHNVRNAYHNPRNNLKRSINKINRQPTLFDVSETLRLTDHHRTLLNQNPSNLPHLPQGV
jgi:hypothetical protein